jgi:hypothetical protein
MCVVSLTFHLLYPWGKCPEHQLNRRMVGPEIWPGSPVEMKISLPCQENNLNYSFILSGPQPTNHTNYTTTAPLSEYLILNICVIFVKDCFYNTYFSFRKK